MALSNDDLRLIAYAVECADLRQEREINFQHAAEKLGKLSQNLRRSWKRLEQLGLVQTNPVIVNSDARHDLANNLRKQDQAEGVLAHMIDPDPDQPRTIFIAEDMQELVRSISAKGLLKPLLIRAHPDPAKQLAGRRMLVDGERRLLAIKAAIEAGDLPQSYRAQVSHDRSSDTPADRILTQLGVNLIHSRMNPMELSDAFERLANEHGLSNADIATSLGKTPEYVQQYRKLQKLSEDDKARMTAGQLSFTEARTKLSEKRRAQPEAAAPQSAPKSEKPAPTDTGAEPCQTNSPPSPYPADWFAPRAGGSAVSPPSDTARLAKPPAHTGDDLVRDSRLIQIEADSANALKRARRALHDPDSTDAEKAELETAIGHLEAVQNHLSAARNAINPQTKEVEPQL